MQFTGVFTALLTPFRGAAIDRPSLERLVDHQLAAGVDGLVVNGTTAESPTLDEAEQAETLSIVLERVAGRVPVVAGVGTNSTATTVTRAVRAAREGANGLLIVNPYYNKPTQAGQIAHFRAVAEAVATPICLYNIPGRTAAGLTLESVVTLSHVPGIAAVKEATGDLRFAAELVASCRTGFTVLSGDDFTFLPLLAVGGQGIIAAGANPVPERFVALYRAWRQGQVVEAQAIHRRLLPLLQALYGETNPIAVKAACAWMGLIDSAALRLPMTPISTAAAERLAGALAEAGIHLRAAP